MIRLSAACARHLLTPDCPALHALGKHISFEMVVGLNGLVWIRAQAGPAQVLHTLLVRNCILNAEFLLLQYNTVGDADITSEATKNATLAAQMEAMVQRLVANSKQLQ